MNDKKLLQISLLISGGITAVNMLSLYFLPLFFLVANFTTVKLLFVGIVEKNIWCMITSCLLILLPFGGAIKVRRKGVCLPALCLALYGGDLVYVGMCILDDIRDRYFNAPAVFSGVVDAIVIVFLILYFVDRQKRKHKVGDKNDPAEEMCGT